LYRLQWIYLNNSETKLTELKSAQFWGKPLSI
jgi:hypothetical protein